MVLRGQLYYRPTPDEVVLVDTVDEPFDVVIDACLATLDLSLVTLPVLENTWYGDTAAFDISYIQQQVVPSVECGYPYSFDVCRVYLDAQG